MEVSNGLETMSLAKRYGGLRPSGLQHLGTEASLFVFSKAKRYQSDN